jgi:soluble lytic murein transglycosylase-like protein
MASLKLAIAWLAASAAGPARIEAVSVWQPFIEEASIRCAIPGNWIEGVMQAESAGQTTVGGRPIRSSAGAIGLMQVMPPTWKMMRRGLGLGNDPDDPRDNILAGACYLKMMYDRFGYPGLFAAYNAGPGRYADHLVTGRPLPGETVAYVGTVAGGALPLPSPAAERPRQALFLVQRDATPSFGEVVRDVASTLFAVKREGPAGTVNSPSRETDAR